MNDIDEIESGLTNGFTDYCDYCGQSRPLDELRWGEIYRNGEYITRLYCKDKPCQSYAQMSAEG